MKTLGISGTAKNTGKTTTTKIIMDYGYDNGFKLGITSIGYDGEEWDNVTGLAKPRIEVKKGMVVAVSERCIMNSTAKIESKRTTNIKTPLGNVIVGIVTEDGLLVVAGPNKGDDLIKVLKLMEEEGCNLTIVDGALNRIAPMTVVDRMILSTGASRNTEPEILGKEARALSFLMDLPLYGEELNYTNITLWTKDGIKELSIPFLLTHNDLRKLPDGDFHKIYIPGTISYSILKEMLKSPHNLEFIFYHPIYLIVGGDLLNTYNLIEDMIKRGMIFSVIDKTPLLGITVNPFYPKFRVQSNYFSAAFIDKEILKKTVRSMVAIPVYNVLDDDLTDLHNSIFKHL